MPDETEIPPILRSLFDRLVKAGWLEQVTDRPKDPNKDLHWVQGEKVGGYEKLTTFMVLYQELSKFGPLTIEDWETMKAFYETVRKSN